jgi:hypothetical protein
LTWKQQLSNKTLFKLNPWPKLSLTNSKFDLFQIWLIPNLTNSKSNFSFIDLT